ncbi:unannotated protein [freshwater metagenome]|uniref:Unannotated protein n=1 Tax=freshwater metagenome TaxID=449393 RepID=A0A6J7DXC4_9ZZZZ|nr:hypothetical protein [Actinomycetota bacterium]
MGLKDRILGRSADSSTVATEPVPDDITILRPGGAVTPAAPQDTLIGGSTAGLDHTPAEPFAPVEPEPETAPAAVTVPAAAPGFRERGRLRRRLRHLRELRELGFRDLGGLVFDQHRFQRPNEDLVAAKVVAIDAVDRELRLLQDTLHDRRPLDELYRAGVSACSRCGTLHGSDANFCPNCGLPFAGLRPVAGMGAAAPQPTDDPSST